MIRTTLRMLLFGWIALLLLLPVAQAGEAPRQQGVTLLVENMTCGLCPVTVRKALEKVPGVIGAEVTAVGDGTGLAKVTFDPAETGVEALVRATTEAGYPSRPKVVE